jgi:hypothetical protein
MTYRPGDPVLLRSIYGGRVRWTFPHTFVEEKDGRIGLLIRPGTKGKWIRRGDDGRYLSRWVTDRPPTDHVWLRNRVLWLARRGDAHMIGVFWDDATDEFRGWYVQLQDPLRSSRFGFDSMDHALDVWIEADGTWEWKDEEDFAEAQALGVFTPKQAAAIRAEAERVLAARPWPTGWEDWRPDPRWQLPELPSGWDVVEA